MEAGLASIQTPGVSRGYSNNSISPLADKFKVTFIDPQLVKANYAVDLFLSDRNCEPFRRLGYYQHATGL